MVDAPPLKLTKSASTTDPPSSKSIGKVDTGSPPILETLTLSTYISILQPGTGPQAACSSNDNPLVGSSAPSVVISMVTVCHVLLRDGNVIACLIAPAVSSENKAALTTPPSPAIFAFTSNDTRTSSPGVNISAANCSCFNTGEDADVPPCGSATK